MSSPPSRRPRANGLDYRNTHYLISASTLEQCPEDTAREVAFMGRSNAGKSSAINALTGQKSLARASKTPGRTQLLNFFEVAPSAYLVDLPGFGYAKVPPKLKAQWERQLERYLQERQSLQGLILLMDIRHPFRDNDRIMIDWAIQSDMPMHILLTKCDKLKHGAARTALLEAQRTLAGMEGQLSVQLFSSLKHDGVRDLARTLDAWLLPEEDTMDSTGQETPATGAMADHSELAEGHGEATPPAAGMVDPAPKE